MHCASKRCNGFGEQGWRSGESARLPPMCPGFDSRTQRLMWVELVVGSLLCSKRFSPGTTVFPLLENQHFHIPIRSWDARTFLNEFLWTHWCSVGKQITLHYVLVRDWVRFLPNNSRPCEDINRVSVENRWGRGGRGVGLKKPQEVYKRPYFIKLHRM